jgi:hypothetical protein
MDADKSNPRNSCLRVCISVATVLAVPLLLFCSGVSADVIDRFTGTCTRIVSLVEDVDLPIYVETPCSSLTSPVVTLELRFTSEPPPSRHINDPWLDLLISMTYSDYTPFVLSPFPIPDVFQWFGGPNYTGVGFDQGVIFFPGPEDNTWVFACCGQGEHVVYGTGGTWARLVVPEPPILSLFALLALVWLVAARLRRRGLTPRTSTPYPKRRPLDLLLLVHYPDQRQQ